VNGYVQPAKVNNSGALLHRYRDGGALCFCGIHRSGGHFATNGGAKLGFRRNPDIADFAAGNQASFQQIKARRALQLMKQPIVAAPQRTSSGVSVVTLTEGLDIGRSL
jgi:hypothetical protein